MGEGRLGAAVEAVEERVALEAARAVVERAAVATEVVAKAAPAVATVAAEMAAVATAPERQVRSRRSPA